ncbi:hypothetical protein N7478_003162 [Penicillium angulare]|uniref:uncharacterized protein n=1 Tax=Penicillium angulare TaxID=116970 RepID=UPI0025411B9E|nr:uncharacterized protein N7478_003162 [Penicillium angulare]KAJ5287476.1 hypothetical protein N7478_003162 [Penicillium angulare]
MSMIGVSFLKTDDAIDFIRELYPTAQRFGFFCSSFDDTYDMLFSANTEQQRNSSEWIAWSRAESTKKYGLVLHDSWLSGLFSMNPIISTDNLVLCLPMEVSLYKAPTPAEWSRLLNETPHPNQKFELSSHTFHLPDLQGPIPIHSMYGLLCSVLLRAFADTHRLVVCSDLLPVDQHQHIPWNICRLDKRASIIAPLLMQLIQLYDTNLRESNPNGIVIWHSIWMLLTIDINVLFRAAGHDGPQPMFDARQTLSSWACTPAARRACLHAVQSLRILSHRKPADGTAFQSVRTLFISALILGFYVLVSPDMACKESPGPRSINFDLDSSVVDWKIIGDEGISNPESPSMVPRNSTKLDDPAVRFIRFGGPILIDGKRYDSGARHAQRIFLEFASLLDEVGTHWMAGYARLLYMIHHTLATP